MEAKSISSIAISVSSGLTPLRSNPSFWTDGDIPWLKTEQLGSKYIYHTNEKITQEALKNTSIKINPVNTISIAMYGEGKTRGSVSILKSEMTTNQACCNIVLKSDIVNVEYVYYFLRTQYKQLRSLSSGVRKNLNSNDIKAFEVRLPDISKQQKIAAVLSALDAKIELNNRINAELEAMAKTLYDYWFLQFDFPDENSKPYQSSGGKMVYNETLKREIPEGWGAGYIGNILEKVPATKKILSKEILAEGMYPVIDQSMDYICGFTNEKKALIKSVRPHIIFGDHTRIIKLINFDFARGADGTQVLLSSDPRMPQHLFYLSLLKIDLSNYGYARHFKFLKETSMILPERNLSERFEIIAQSAFNKIKHSTLENQQLTQLRDWLLPMLMNGQVTVK